MSSGTEHRECAEALGAYALDALPPEENERVRRHLATCRECRAELEGMRAAVDALPASVAQIEPPPELKLRLMEIVQAEADVLQAAGESADRPPPSGRPRRWPWFSSAAAWRPALAVAAVCVLALVVVLLATSGGTGTRTIAAQVSNPVLGSRVQASLVVHGAHAQLKVSGLPAPAADHTYELWVKRGAAAPRPAGTFVVHSGSVDVGRLVQSGDLVLVSVEPGRGSPAPTTTPIIAAKV